MDQVQGICGKERCGARAQAHLVTRAAYMHCPKENLLMGPLVRKRAPNQMNGTQTMDTTYRL